VITVSPSGSGMRACTVPNPPSPMITSGYAALNRASRSSWSGSPSAPGDPVHLAGPVPVDREQHGAEYRAVVGELAADRDDQLVALPGWVLVPPGSDGGAGLDQVRGVLFPDPHGRLHGQLLNPAVHFIEDVS